MEIEILDQSERLACLSSVTKKMIFLNIDTSWKKNQTLFVIASLKLVLSLIRTFKIDLLRFENIPNVIQPNKFSFITNDRDFSLIFVWQYRKMHLLQVYNRSFKLDLERNLRYWRLQHKGTKSRHWSHTGLSLMPIQVM